ncbi:hypothetical protein GJAV_G00121040 [Gymnothorax javanicus]|nr:hypothetical protein GJAV_G00121040 [Gymnothorax javanicus]
MDVIDGDTAHEEDQASDHGNRLLSEEGVDDGDRGDRDSSHQAVGDLCDLPVPTEASILAVLRSRFHRSQIYTYAGGVLVAVNPFRFLPIYNPKYVKLYKGHVPGQLRPHVFGVADLAFYSTLQRRVSQCIILMGENGSGKTQTANFLLHCLTALSRKGYTNSVERTVLGAGPVLEAFGNAKTVHNDNSSRFGRLIQVHYLESGIVQGAVLHRYFLEKSRVVSRDPCERNYHVFYYMLAGASQEERRELKLLPPQDYQYLTQVSAAQGSTLALEYKRLQQAMEMIGFLLPTRKQIFAVLSAILYLGNLTYTCIDTDTDEGPQLGPSAALKTLSHLLQVKQEMLVVALTKRTLLTAKHTLSFPYSQSEANAVRNSLAKALYSALFDWIVLRINHSLLSRKGSVEPSELQQQCLSIAVLDLFGFESCRDNGFEQFCINYASELLHYYYNQHIFELEQEEYQTEGLVWQRIDYRDNSGCIHLFSDQPSGLMQLLYEEGRSPHGTDKTLLDRFHQDHHGNPCFSADPETELAFVIQHFAGKVKYHVKDFRAKDADRLPGGVATLLKHSRRAFVRSLLGADPLAAHRWGVVRAVFRTIAAFKKASRNAGQRLRGSRTPIGQLRRKSNSPMERLQSSRNSPLEFSFDRSEEHPLDVMEDIFASYERRKRNRGNRQKQMIPKNLMSTHTLKCIVDLTLRDPSVTLHVPFSSAQLQMSLCKVLQTLKDTHPFFIQCIRSNAAKKEMCFDDALVLRQLQNSGLLETVLMQGAGYSAKVTLQEFSEMFRVLLPKDLADPQEEIRTLLQQAGLSASSYQIGRTKVYLKASLWQLLQRRLRDTQGQELHRTIVVLQRWFRANHERREFLRKRAAAIAIQRWWRSIREESHYQAAAMIQALWRGSQQRAEYLRKRKSIVKMQALVRGSLARRRCQLLKDGRDAGVQQREAETGEVGAAEPPNVQETRASRRSQTGKELRRQNNLEHESPNIKDLKEERREGGELDGPPCPASPGTLQRYYKHSAMKKKAAKWRERRSEGGLRDNSPETLKMKDKRTRSLKVLLTDPICTTCVPDLCCICHPSSHSSQGLSLSLDNISKLSSSESDSPVTEKPEGEFQPSAKVTTDGSEVKSPERTSNGSSPVTSGRPGFLRRLLRKRNRDLQHVPEEPVVTPMQTARGLGWAPAPPLRPTSGHGRRNPSIRISRATRVSEKWNASLEREITSTAELCHLDQFLGKQVNDLRSRGKPLSSAENIFLTATMSFREMIKGMYFLSKPQIRYKGLLRNYEDKVSSLAGPRRDSEVKLVVNLFQSVLDGFVRGEMRKEDSGPSEPSKKEKKKSSKDKCIRNHTLRTYQSNIIQSCDQCGSTIWGMEKAFICCTCEMICHKKCLSKISEDCAAVCAKKNDSGQFGVRVSRLLSDSNLVPVIVEKMLGHVEMNGLYTEGIYRKSGSASRARELHQLLNTDQQNVCLEDYPIHTITCLVKKWLRELPDPLMTFAHYDDFLRAMELSEKPEKLRRLYKVLEQLPTVNFNTLERLFFHLVIVAKEEKHNRMSANSLAIVFAPCLLRSPNTSDPLMSMKDIGKITTCVEMLINEQLRRYNEKMEEIEQLELAEALAINELRLKRQNTVLERESEASKLQPPESNMEERSLMERIKSIKQEKDELAYRLPELEQPGSDNETLDSESLLSCESLLDLRLGSPCAEGEEDAFGSPHPSLRSWSDRTAQHRGGVQSMFVPQSQDSALTDLPPAPKTGRTMSDTDIPYIDDDI